MYNLIEYSDIYSRNSGSLWQYYRDKVALNNAWVVIGFPANNNSIWYKCKEKIISQTEKDTTKDAKVMVPLKYLHSSLRTLEMSLMKLWN